MTLRKHYFVTNACVWGKHWRCRWLIIHLFLTIEKHRGIYLGHDPQCINCNYHQFVNVMHGFRIWKNGPALEGRCSNRICRRYQLPIEHVTIVMSSRIGFATICFVPHVIEGAAPFMSQLIRASGSLPSPVTSPPYRTSSKLSYGKL